MRIIFLGCLMTCLLSVGCSKDVCPNQQEGVITPGIYAGCGYLIKLDNGSWLEPTNLEDYIDIQTEGGGLIRVSVSYHQAQGVGSYCMTGKIVEINCLTEL